MTTDKTAAGTATASRESDTTATNVSSAALNRSKEPSNGTSVTRALYPLEVAGAKNFSFTSLLALVLLVPMIATVFLGRFNVFLYLLLAALTALPIFVTVMVVQSRSLKLSKAELNSNRQYPLPKRALSEYITMKDSQLAATYGGAAVAQPERKIPLETFFEAYFAGKIDIEMDMLELMEHRHDWASFQFTWGHVKYFLFTLLPEALGHSRKQDESQVRDHYDRGDTFYRAFLGSSMVYTSGIIRDPTSRESLEQLQRNKLDLVCDKIQLRHGERHLDIGCGWGTLVVHAAEKYGSDSTGVTLGRNQAAWAHARAQERGVAGQVDILCMDYRDIPKSPIYHKITCLEMAEHVGVRKFGSFLQQVSSLLADDGLFFLQIAGLRRSWQFEDLIWGIFMNKYVFPGADASLPLNWVVAQLEYNGFEVLSVDTIGVHYSATIERWYRNWIANRARVAETYGERWARIWEFFLAYSTIIARQGSATCYQIVCHKNLNRVDRNSLISAKRLQA